ncbi:FIG00554570: hypothetical protein [Cronobacter sakazakii 701]|nr:FIG00554570: hypothetical protein [Cronobacter sakazakii 701]
MLSVMQSQGGLDLLFMIAPFIAIVGMTKSFLGVCLPVAETITALVAGHAGMKKQAKTLAFLAMFIATFGVVDLNPDVITLIETVCGPLTAIFLFLIPTYLIYTRDALRSLRGPTAVMVVWCGHSPHRAALQYVLIRDLHLIAQQTLLRQGFFCVRMAGCGHFGDVSV